MERINKLSERIVTLSPESIGKDRCINAVSINIEYFVIDIMQAMKNIRETSLNKTDMLVRMNDLSRHCGIDLTKYI